MARYKTFVNGGPLLPSDLDAIEDDYECAFGTYKKLYGAETRLDAPTAGTYLAVTQSTGPGVAATAANASLASFYLDPARYWSAASTSSTNARSVFLNLAFSALTNSTAVGTVTFTVGLYPVTAAAGSTAAQGAVTIGGAVTGSTVTISNPAASSLIPVAYSGDFAAPAAGFYVVGIVVTAAAASNSSVTVLTEVQMRQV